MKTTFAVILGAMLAAGCGPFNTVPLYRDYTPYRAFLDDRDECVVQAARCIAQRYANSSYNGEKVDKLYPSRGAYLACMSARGYQPAAEGYLPPVLVVMNDYPPGRDCFSR